jgi:hypothetical protein
MWHYPDLSLVWFSAAVGPIADFERSDQAESIYEYTA